MNKRKILMMALALCMVAILAVGGSLAYLTDTDADHNTFVVGNVNIKQNEEQRPVDTTATTNDKYTSGNAIAYVDGNKLLPAVVTDGSANGSYDGSVTLKCGDTYKVWGSTINNEIDKIITVTNTGTEAAYVRTIIAFEDDAAGSITPSLHTLWGFNGDGSYVEATATPDANGEYVNLPDADVVWLKNADDSWLTIEINGVLHTVAVITYTEALAAEDTTVPSLMQVWLDPSVGNDWIEKVKGTDGKYTISAVSLAVQEEGFATASLAMDTAFDLTAANLTTWFNGGVAVETTGDANVSGM